MSQIILPPQGYIAPSPAYAFNGNCEGCSGPIFGDAFICKKGEYHIDCAVAAKMLCNNCFNDTDQCSCPQVTQFYVPVRITEAA